MSRERERKFEQALKHQLRATSTPDREACIDAETLAAWADGGLDPAQMASVEMHVSTCARCQAVAGATARSEPVTTGSEAPATFRLWKWWLAPIGAAAAAVMLWMVVPQEREVSVATPPPVAAPAADTLAQNQSRDQAGAERKEEAAPTLVEDKNPAGAVARETVAAPRAVAVEELQKRSRPAVTSVEIVSPDPTRRWRIVGATLQRTEDSGTTWTPLLTVGDSLTSGVAPTSGTCWLIGRGGLVMVSGDGITFARVPLPEAVDVSAITATDARSATVTAADGRRFRTDDSGRTWHRL